jgi:hypothetical protein
MTQPIASAVPRTAVLLGALGLLPFIGLALLIVVEAGTLSTWQALLRGYALAIVSFLAGVWWGLSLLRRQVAPMVLGNLIVIGAWAGQVLLSPAPALVLLTALLLAEWLAERRLALFRPQPVYYARLRTVLTLVASTCLLLAAWALSR